MVKKGKIYNKNTNKNIINIKIGDTKHKKKKSRNKKKKSLEYSTNPVYNQVIPQLPTLLNKPPYDLTPQVEKEKILKLQQTPFRSITAHTGFDPIDASFFNNKKKVHNDLIGKLHDEQRELKRLYPRDINEMHGERSSVEDFKDESSIYSSTASVEDFNDENPSTSYYNNMGSEHLIEIKRDLYNQRYPNIEAAGGGPVETEALLAAVKEEAIADEEAINAVGGKKVKDEDYEGEYEDEAPKRGPGRPRGSKNKKKKEEDEDEPYYYSENDKDERRGPGRPRGSKNKK